MAGLAPRLLRRGRWFALRHLPLSLPPKANLAVKCVSALRYRPKAVIAPRRFAGKGYAAGPTITFYLGKWGCACQFCSDRAKTSDLDVSDGLKSIPAVAEAKNIGSKKFFFFFWIRSYFPTLHPLFRPWGTPEIDRSPSVLNPTKRNQVRNCNQKSARGKRNFTD